MLNPKPAVIGGAWYSGYVWRRFIETAQTKQVKR